MNLPRMIAKCVDDTNVALTCGEEYDVEWCTPTYYWLCDDDGDVLGFSAERFEVIQYGLTLSQCRNEYYGDLDYNFRDKEVIEQSAQKPIDAHYTGFTYTLTQKDVEMGNIKLDPYFVSQQWQLGKRDDSGVLFHCLKTLARFGDKNSREREIHALHLQVKRLAELEGVKL